MAKKKSISPVEHLLFLVMSSLPLLAAIVTAQLTDEEAAHEVSLQADKQHWLTQPFIYHHSVQLVIDHSALCTQPSFLYTYCLMCCSNTTLQPRNQLNQHFSHTASTNTQLTELQ